MRHQIVSKTTAFVIAVIYLFFIGCNSSTSPDTNAKTSADPTTAVVADPIEGEWELVWSANNGQISHSGKPIQFKMFHNGFYSLIMQDSVGTWTTAGAGTYEVNGNTYKETFKYVSVPQYLGLTNWQEFEIRGDTLYNRLFKKVVDSTGKDITNQFPTTLEEKRVRAKR